MSQHLIHFRVTGRVQGVSFRYYTHQEATKLKLAGWVRNNPDDSVEGAAAGPAPAIQKFRAYLDKGPSSAQVDKVHLMVDEQEASQETIQKILGDSSTSFEIRKR